jgi:hypothetical protein
MYINLKRLKFFIHDIRKFGAYDISVQFKGKNNQKRLFDIGFDLHHYKNDLWVEPKFWLFSNVEDNSKEIMRQDDE